MSMLFVKLLVDSLMIVLLGATIFYCIMVNRRIRVLQDSREDFAKLITKFDATTHKAQETITDLKKMSQRVTESLNERLDKANFLADDLAFMIEKGNKVADKVDRNMPRDMKSGSSALPPKREPLVGRGGNKKNKARDSLIKDSGDDVAEPSNKERKNKVESMLERLGDRDAPKPSRRSGRASARLRSRAEKELQDALKSGND